MILIIDNYFTPAYRIKDFLYKNRRLEPFVEDFSDDAVYFIHSECVGNLQKYIYLAEEVVEVKGDRLLVLKKKKRCVSWYRIEGKAFVKEELVGEKKSTKDIERLPYIRAQDEEIVIFPSDDEE